MTNLKLPFFSRGEISPRLYGRVDTTAYQSGLKTARNAIVSVGGGIMNRPGLVFIGTAKYADRYTRLIPFSFKVNDTHMLEFGDGYMRVIREDFYQLTLDPKTVSGITKEAHCMVTTSTSHGYTTGQAVRLGVTGMTEVNNRTFNIEVVNVTTFKLKNTIDDEYIDSTGYTTFISGTVDSIYEVATQYAEEDLPLLKYTQSADVMTLTHTAYPPKDLKRFALNAWRFEDPVFVPSTDYPVNIAVVDQSGAGDTDLVWYRYQVTAIDDKTGIESLAGEAAGAYQVLGATKANPCVITTMASHPFEWGDPVRITGVSGMTELNDKRFIAGDTTTDTFQLFGIDSTSYGTFTSAVSDSIYPLFFKVQSQKEAPNTVLTWNSLPGIEHYSVYREVNGGQYAFIGESRRTTFSDVNITPDETSSPPVLNNPFEGVDNYPGACGYYQQRRLFGGSNNHPDSWNASKAGDFTNFTTSFPTKDDDAIAATLVSGQVNQIKHFITQEDMVILTSGSTWAVNGGSGVFSPFTVNVVPQANWGISEHRPFVVDKKIVFVQEDNRTVRDLAFSFNPQTYGYQSNDLTITAEHLFRDTEIRDWALARTPYSALVATRTDGDAAMLVVNEEQAVTGWTHWDTLGDFQTVAAVRVCLELETPEPDDGIYFVVKRKIDGNTVQFVERLHKRRFNDVRDGFFVDCGVKYDPAMRITEITAEGAGGAYLITVPSHGYSPEMVVDFSDIEWEPVIDDMGNETQPAQLNDTKYVVDAVVNSNSFTIKEISDTYTPVIPPVGWKPYVKGGVARENVYIVDGLFHLNNMTVSICADGYPVRDVLVTDGEVTLPGLASRIMVGLPYTCDIQTLPIEAAAGINTIQGRRKRIPNVTVRLEKSRECMVGPNNLNLIPMKRAPYQTQVSAQLYTGDINVNILPTWGTDGNLFFRQRDPLPLNILAVFPDVDITT